MAKQQPVLVTQQPQSAVVERLNAVLRNELAGINQYFLHARMLKHMGFMKLADFEYKESIDEMRHSDLIINRILFLGGVPQMQDIGQLRIGNTVDDILRNDLALEDMARDTLREAITVAEPEDSVTANMLHTILQSEDEHVQYIRTQLNLIDTIGLTAYLQTQV